MSAWLLAVVLFSLQCFSAAALILYTPKRSILRYLWVPCSAWIAYKIVVLSPHFSDDTHSNSTTGPIGIIAGLQGANLLLLNPLCADDFPHSTTNVFSRIWSVGVFICNTRAANTRWQVKNTPAHPVSFWRGVTPDRGWFIVRQSLIRVWQYVVLDVAFSLDPVATPGEFRYFHGVSLEQWMVRIVKTVVSWSILLRLMIDSGVRHNSIIAVGARLGSPDNWVPTFGSIWDAYTVRNFWGKFWHQSFRWPFTSLSSFLTRDVLRFPHPSLLERYTNLLFVFLLSGSLHLLIDVLRGIPREDSVAMMFFTCSALAIMIEDGVQELWRRATKNVQVRKGTRLWQKIIGYIWVVAVFSFISPPYLHSGQTLPPESRPKVSFSIVERIGIPNSCLGLVVGGLVLKFAFGAEV